MLSEVASSAAPTPRSRSIPTRAATHVRSATCRNHGEGSPAASLRAL